MDVFLRQGIYPGQPTPPFTPGCVVVGYVDKVGSKVTDFLPGQRIVALTLRGGYAEYVCIPAKDLVISPPELDPVLSEPLVMSYLAAYQLLHRCAKVTRGERILIHDAGSDVGIALIQLGKLLELEIYAAAPPEKHRLINRLGATAINYHKQYVRQAIMDLTNTGVDAVFDPVGGVHWLNSYRCLRPCGRLVMFGINGVTSRGPLHQKQSFLSKFVTPHLAILPMFKSSKSVISYNIGTYKSFKPELYHNDLKTLLSMLKLQKIKPIIAQKFELKEAAQAHKFFESSKNLGGNVVLVCKPT